MLNSRIFADNNAIVRLPSDFFGASRVNVNFPNIAQKLRYRAEILTKCSDRSMEL